AGLSTGVPRLRPRRGGPRIRRVPAQVRPRKPLFLQCRPVQQRWPPGPARPLLRRRHRRLGGVVRSTLWPRLQGHSTGRGDRYRPGRSPRPGCSLRLQPQGDEGPWRRRRDRGQPPRGGCVDHRRRHLRRDLGAGIRRHHPGPWRPAGGRRHRPRPTRAGSGWALGRRRDHGNLRHAGIQHRHPRRPDRVPGDGSRRRRSAPGHQGLPGPLWRV
ncbi:MAG: Orotate phosphoribosyltransferase (EC 2.4.2.10), partial [Olavius algarvensis Gamma 1 endosymbiont]